MTRHAYKRTRILVDDSEPNTAGEELRLYVDVVNGSRKLLAAQIACGQHCITTEEQILQTVAYLGTAYGCKFMKDDEVTIRRRRGSVTPEKHKSVIGALREGWQPHVIARAFNISDKSVSLIAAELRAKK